MKEKHSLFLTVHSARSIAALTVALIFLPWGVFAAYDTYAPGSTITLGDFVYDDALVATTTDNCTITVYNPSGSIAVNAQPFSIDANGWHHYSLALSTDLGVWPAFMSCGSPVTGDYVKEDLTFQVSDYAVSSSTVAALVNAHTDVASSSLGSAIGNATTQVNAHTDSTVLSASSSLATTLPGVIWSYSARTLTSFGSLVADIWSYSTRSLTSGVEIASDIWNAATRTLTGAGLSSGQLAVQTDVTSATTNVNSHTDSAVANSTSDINTHTDTSTSGIASAVNTNTNAAILTASSSLASAITALPASVWAYSTRTLTSMQSMAADVWTYATRTLTSLTLTSTSPWTVSLADSNTIAAGSTYHATVTTVLNGTLTDSLNVPTITIYDPNHNVIVNAAAMTRSGVGTYQYSYATAGGSPAGTWESDVSANVQTGQTLPGISYWNLNTSPAQVIIHNVGDTTVPTVAADVTITNEGAAGYEYHYVWCVVPGLGDTCGGGRDIFFASAAKYINPGEDFNTTLTATVPDIGTYYFKVIAYFGTEASGASRSFVATTDSPSGGNNGGGIGGGGGGGGGSVPVTIPPLSTPLACQGADLNGDRKVNTIDFSILLSFWKKNPPYKNPCVDINHDGKVNAQDFSIMLSQWGTVGKPIP